MTILLTGALTVGATGAARAQPGGDDHHGRPDRQARKRVPPPAAPTPAPTPAPTTHDDDRDTNDRDRGQHGGRHDDDRPAPPAAPTPAPPVAGQPGRGDHRPRQAPPAPPAEPQAERAGYVWAAGNWDWKDDQYQWTPGHWERARAGKKWRATRWEARGDSYERVDGDWVDEGADTAAPPTPPPTDARPRPPRREWKLERPMVSSYWPTQGKAGAKVVIRGRNFAADTAVEFAGAQITGAKVTPTEIKFAVAADAATGPIVLRSGQGRPLVVGNFEVAAPAAPVVDVAAEQAKLEAERQRAAQEAWAARQGKLAKDRAAREAAVRERWSERDADRDQRRAARADEIRGKWQAAFLADPSTQDELTLHAQRTAALGRMRDLAEVALNSKLAVRVDVLQSREDDRHTQRMTALEAGFKAGGAQ